MTHEIKIDPKYLIRIIEEEKMFEVRINDRDYQVGDIIKFLPVENKETNFNSDNKLNVNSIIKMKIPFYKITYIHSGLGMKDGYVIWSIKPLTNKGS